MTVTWGAPADGGSAITGYTVTLTPVSGEPIVRSAAAGATSLQFADVPAGTWSATVAATNAIGASPASASSSTVTVAGTSTPDPDPAATDPTPVPDAELTEGARGGMAALESANAGQQITITVPGQAGEQVRIWLHSTPLLLGTVTLDASGKATVTIPAGTPAGAHRIVVQAMDGGLIGWADIRVAALATTGADLNLPATVSGALLLMLLGAGALVAARRRGSVIGRLTRRVGAGEPR